MGSYHHVNQAVLKSLLSAHPIIALRIGADGLIISAGVFSQHAVQLFPALQNVPGRDLDFRGMTLGTARSQM